MTKRVPRLACAHNPDWLEVEDEEPYKYAATNPMLGLAYWYEHFGPACPGCKEKDGTIATLTRELVAHLGDVGKVKSEAEQLDSIRDQLMADQDKEIFRLKKLVAEKEKDIGGCHQVIAAERAKNAVMVDGDIDQLKEIISKIDDIRYALDSLELR